MAAKVKCPACGAKNALDAPRCRVCTAMIDVQAPADRTVPDGPSHPSPGIGDHFDPGVIDRQIQPARSRFAGTSSGGGLSARIASANGGAMPRSVFGSRQTPAGRSAPASSLAGASSEARTAYDPRSASPTPSEPSSNDDVERFDADALFRDMGSPG
jgi:hypothetical protein